MLDASLAQFGVAHGLDLAQKLGLSGTWTFLTLLRAG